MNNADLSAADLKRAECMLDMLAGRILQDFWTDRATSADTLARLGRLRDLRRALGVSRLSS